MAGTEDTPFVIDFKQKSLSNYGSATICPDSPTVSGINNNVSQQMPATSSTLYCLHGQSNVEVRSHCHRQRSEGVDVKARKKLIIASVLCLFFMIAEIIGGVLSNSLAIATDAAHLLTDFASFMISLFAIWIAGRPSTQRMSFGWYRAEVIGAMASVVMIWVITAILVWLAVERLINRDFEIEAEIMLITSGLAILVNIIMGAQLQHGHSHGMIGDGHSHEHGSKKKKSKGGNVIEDPTGLASKHSKRGKKSENFPNGPSAICERDAVCPISPTQRIEDGVAGDLAVVNAELPTASLNNLPLQNSHALVNARSEAELTAEPAHKDGVNINVRAAFIHVIGDMIQSVGVFVAALVIYFRPDWVIVDPICTFIFSVIVLITTFAIMKDALLVLMEGTPSYMHYAEVLSIFQQIEGVERVHNLRIWALSINKTALSVHLAIDPHADPKRILEEANRVVHRRYNFFETTIQIEEFTPDMENCRQCVVPQT